MEQIKNFEEACEKRGYDAATILPDFSVFPEPHRKAMIAHAKLVIITEALNDNHKHDWGNGEWDKYYPWFRMGDSSGSGFSFFVYADGRSNSIVGSRLAFRSVELAEYAGQQFLDLYKDYFLVE